MYRDLVLWQRLARVILKLSKRSQSTTLLLMPLVSKTCGMCVIRARANIPDSLRRGRSYHRTSSKVLQ
jgi:hypothetical protein